MFGEIFEHRRVIEAKLSEYGFWFDGKEYTISKNILNDEFKLTVTIDSKGASDTTLVETELGEEYTLYKNPSAQGSFIGEVRSAIIEVLQDIAEKCFDDSIFKQAQTLKVLKHARDEFGNEPEFLWEKFPNYCALRRSDNSKWYATIMLIPKNKLGIDSKELAEVIDLKAKKDEIPKLLEQENFYPGWHMNKKSWYTVILDGSVPDDELIMRLEESYRLAK